MSSSPPKGTFDVTPFSDEMWQDSLIWQIVEKQMHEVCRLFGLMEIKTPIFEQVELFKRSSGDGSDIVSKEMYEFKDKGGRDLALRPEGTASAARAIINNHLYDKLPITKLYYFGPMFRYERGQKGRYRQHYQFGVELIGLDDAFLDSEGIEILWYFYERLGLKNKTLHLNSIGDLEARNHYRKKLLDYLTPYKNDLSADSKERLEKNPLRILDSKDPKDQDILIEAPKILDCLNNDSKNRFEKVKIKLDQAGIPFHLDPRLVRGLDYYSHTVFEIKSNDLGAQNTLGAGGRYDDLISLLGGKQSPAFGFATGIERIIHTYIVQNPNLEINDFIDLFLCPIDESAISFCENLARLLRRKTISVMIDPRGKKISQSISYAVKIKAKYFIAIGENEKKTNKVLIKTLKTKQEKLVDIKTLESFIYENSI